MSSFIALLWLLLLVVLCHLHRIPVYVGRAFEMQIHSLTFARLVDTELLALSIEKVTYDRLFDL